MSGIAEFRPVDPVLSGFSLAYRNGLSVYAADTLFPFTPSQDGGDTGTFFIADPLNALRSRDVQWSFTEGATRGQSRYTKGSWSALPYAWEEGVPDAWVRNFANGGSNRQGLIERAAQTCVDVVTLGREVRAWTAATSVAPSGSTGASLSGTAKWGSTAANPRADIKTGSATILKKTAAPANAGIISGSVVDSITGTQSAGSAGALIIASFGYDKQVLASDINENLCAQYFGLPKLKFAIAVQSDATKYVNTTIPGGAGLPEIGSYVWSDDEFYIFRSDQGEQVVSYGQTFGSDLGTADQYYEPKPKTTVVRFCQTIVEKVTCSGAIYVLGTIL